MKNILLIVTLLSSICYGDIEVNIPEDWVPQAIPELPPNIHQLHKSLSPDGGAEVLISESDIFEPIDDASESYIRGVKKSSNYKHIKTSVVQLFGEEGRHVQGAFIDTETNSKMLNDTYLLYKNNRGILVGLTTVDSTQTTDVLSWIDFPEVIDPPKIIQTTQTPFSIAELLGKLVVWGAVISAIIIIVKSKKKTKRG